MRTAPHPRKCAPPPPAAPQTMPYWSYARGEILHHAELKHPFIVDLREIFLTRGEGRGRGRRGCSRACVARGPRR